jgi:hypothetical protein
MPCFPVAGDLKLSADGRELVLVAGADLVRQQVIAASQIWQGWWVYDESVGLPMLSSVLVKGADLRVVTQVFRDWLLSLSGVTSVTTCVCALDRVARTLTVTFAVVAEDGTTLADEVTFAVG